MAPQPPVTTDMEPIAGFKFSVALGDKTVAWFTECSGLSVERTVLPYEEGGVNNYVHQLPDRLKHTSVTLKRGVGDSELWTWFQDGLYDAKVTRKDVAISLYNGDRSQVKRWNLARAYPTKWTAPDFKADGNTVAIETLQIVHEGITVTDWAQAASS